MPVGLIAKLISGGGGGGDSVSYRIVSTVQGGDRPIAVDSTIQGGTNPLTVDVGLDDVNVDVGGTGTPLHAVNELRVPEAIKTETEAEVGFAVTRPIVSDISSKLDVEPMQVDLCLNVGLTKLPRAGIRQPYESHFGVTILGIELMGFDWTGESNVMIDELPSHPRVVGSTDGGGLGIRLG